jgi:heterotetrameric sarcosine oxidase gamma subunit
MERSFMADQDVPASGLGSKSRGRLARSPLAQALGGSSIAEIAGLRIALVDPGCQLLISGDTGASEFLDAARGALGAPLPLEPNRVAGKDVYSLWLAPGRWLAVAEPAAGRGLAERVRRAIAPSGGFASEVTEGLAVFELEGPATRDLLSTGTTLDLRMASLSIGQASQTIFAGVHATLYPHRSAHRFRLHVERSVAEHVRAWLAKSASAFESPMR